ncbi:MAG: SpoIIE family protein phosphatase [Actinomycetota bacterium]
MDPKTNPVPASGPDATPSAARASRWIIPAVAAAFMGLAFVAHDASFFHLAVLPAAMALVALAGFMGGWQPSTVTAVIVTVGQVFLMGGPGLRFTSTGVAEVIEIASSTSLIAVATGVLRARAEGIFIERQARREADRALSDMTDQIDGLDVAVWEATAATPPAFRRIGRGIELITGFEAKHWIADEGFWTSHIHPEDVELTLKMLRTAISECRPVEIEYRFMSSGQETIWLNDIVQVCTDQRGTPISLRGRMIDVTEAKRAEMRLSVVHSASVAMNMSRSINEAAPKILSAICESLGWQAGIIWELESDSGPLVFLESWAEDATGLGRFIEASGSSRFTKGLGLPGTAWESLEPRWIPDVIEEANFPRKEAAQQAGIHGAFAFPITSGRRVSGVIEFFSTTIEEPDQDLLMMMSSIGGRIGQYLETIKAEEATRISEARKSAILRSAMDAIVTIDAEGRITEFNPAAESTFGFTRDQVIGKTLEETLVPLDLRARHRAGLRRAVSGHNKIIGQRMEMPAMRKDGSQILVELSITRVESDGPTSFTGYLRDITEKRKVEDAKAFLARASDVLGSSLDHEKVIAQVCALAIPILGDHCVVDLIEDDQSITRLAEAGSGNRPFELESLHETYLSDADENHPLIGVLTSAVSYIQPGAARACIAALMTRGRVIGTIGVGIAGDRTYTADDLDLLEDLARKVSRALDNAFEYRRESNIASILQKSLIPELPHIPGVQIGEKFLPAGEGNEVGGDFYDVFKYGQGHWAVVIGDVSGKGPEAARLAGVVKNTVRAEALQEREPSRILSEVNSAIQAQKAIESQFSTAAFARLDPIDNGAFLTIVLGGHPQPLVRRLDGRVESVGEPGTLLGLFEATTITEQFVTLGPGDAIMFYTDGVTEASSNGDIYSDSRLKAVLEGCLETTAQAIADRIAESVRDFSSGNARDDVAVLVIKIPPAT